MLKDMMVFVQAGARRTTPQLAAAVAVAKAHSAALVGVCAVEMPPIPAYAEAPIGVELIEQELERRRGLARQLETQFLDATKRAGVTAEWRTVEADPLSAALAHGRAADVVVAAQTDPEGALDAINIEELALSLGRPVLTIPYVGAPASIGETVLLGWNNSREATRATHDALPFLKTAKTVLVVGVDVEEEDRASLDRLVAHLARHGVTAAARQTASGGLDVGDVLLNAAADEGADLIVMGAYGHSRVRELVLGGATRTMFRQMTAPVLFSH